MVSIQRRKAVRAALALGVVAASATVVLTAGSGSVAAAGTAEASASTVTVSGTGLALGSPDVLQVTLAVTKRGADVSSAMNGANARVQKIREALKNDKVAARDIQTADFSVERTYSKKNPGYRATQSLSVTLRDLDRAGRTIADAAAAGGNATRIYGVSYDIEDRAGLLRKARDLAFADAKAKAQRYAELAGRPLGAVREISEGTGEDSYDKNYCGGCGAAAAGAPAADSSSVPLAAGSQRVSLSSTVIWELG